MNKGTGADPTHRHVDGQPIGTLSAEVLTANSCRLGANAGNTPCWSLMFASLGKAAFVIQDEPSCITCTHFAKLLRSHRPTLRSIWRDVPQLLSNLRRAKHVFLQSSQAPESASADHFAGRNSEGISDSGVPLSAFPLGFSPDLSDQPTLQMGRANCSGAQDRSRIASPFKFLV